MKIKPGTGTNVVKRAFRSLKPLMLWDEDVGDYPGLEERYFPYLVYFRRQEGDVVYFVGVDLTTEKEFEGERSVRLNDIESVWSRPPSTLEGFNEDNPYAILFLHEKFDPSTALKAARGGGKYPKSLGRILDKLKVDLKAFRQSLTNERTIEEFDKVFGEHLEDE